MRALIVSVCFLAACAVNRADMLPDGRFDFGEAPSGFEAVPDGHLCVTSGAVRRLARAVEVNGRGMRAVVAGKKARSVELAFAYLGPSRTEAALASGEMRRQIGLKLRAKDTCNVVYVMWHLEPVPGVHVSVKSNPGAATHAECADRGYINVRPEHEARIHSSGSGPHRLRADLAGDRLVVRSDEVVVWEGHLPAEAFAFDGPAGIRTDNAAFELQLRVPADSIGETASCDGALVD